MIRHENPPETAHTAENTQAARTRFTLIELLVVVAIIAVLAALLLPVLGRARYRAKLTVCSNTQRQLGLALSMYANTNDDYYPTRSSGATGIQNYNYIIKGWGGDGRPQLRDYMRLDELLACNMSPVPQGESLDTGNNAILLTGYELWAGYQGMGGMNRLGDRMTYKGEEFSAIATDRYFYTSLHVTGIASSHPDTHGALLYDPLPAYATTIWRRHVAGITQAVGAVDRNFLRDDGSVTMHTALRFEDGRLSKVPADNTIGYYWGYLPTD